MIKTLITPALVLLCLFSSCTKNSDTITNIPKSNLNPAIHSNSNARYAGSDYSQSIPVDTANKMILSYLNSVSYPLADTALRSMVFDADTLRAYLQNPNIVTVKFMLAHRQEYANNAGKNGKYVGLQPTALTMIVVGLNDNDQYVLNSQSGVYEHLKPCPYYCGTNSNALIQ